MRSASVRLMPSTFARSSTLAASTPWRPPKCSSRRCRRRGRCGRRFDRGPEVDDHRYQGNDRRSADHDVAHGARVEEAEQHVVVEQERDRDQLRHGLQLAGHVHGDALRLADLRHPLPQRRDGDLAADDDERHDRVDAPELGEHDQRRGHHQLVGYRVQERAEGRGLVPLAREVAVEPVGHRRADEDPHRDHVARLLADPVLGDVEHRHEQRDRDDAQPREEQREVEPRRQLNGAPGGCARPVYG